MANDWTHMGSSTWNLLQSVAKLMTHLTVFGEFSSIPNLGKTSPLPHTRTMSHMGMITNGLAEEHSHSIQAEFYAILTENGTYTRIFVGVTFGQSVSKLMTHLTVFGEFSSISNLSKTSPPPPPCTMLSEDEMTIVPEKVINIDWGGGGKFGKRYFFSCSTTFIKKIIKFCRVCHEFWNRLWVGDITFWVIIVEVWKARQFGQNIKWRQKIEVSRIFAII